MPAPVEPMKTHDPVVVAAMKASEGGSLKNPGMVAVSPDGKWLAYTVGGRAGGGLHLMELANPDPAKDRIISPNGDTSCRNGSPVWSPDGGTLAYTSSCTGTQDKGGQEQVFLWSRGTGASKQLTQLKGLFQHVAWSPDGKTIAFLFVENATRSAGALAAMKPWSGVIGEDGIEVQRVAAVDVVSGTMHFVTPSTLHAFEFDWSPKGGEVAYVAAAAPGENNWWVANLYTQGVRSGSQEMSGEPKVLVDTSKVAGDLHGLQMAVPKWSPDGKKIAFIGGLMSDQGSTGGDIWVVNAKGGEPVDVTPGIDGTPGYESWTGNDQIGFVEDRRGHTLLADYSVSKKATDAAPYDLGEVSVGGGAIKDAIAVSNNGVLAMVKSGLTSAPEVWAGPYGGLKQVTHLNDGAKTAGGKTESVEWENGGFHVQGWLTYPVNYDPAKKYPMIVSVHGGPSASVGARFGMMTTYSLAGYFVLQPNPRGSFGQGEAFTAANRKDFGYGDLKDILAGMDAVEKKVSVDPKREGLTGWSYGGFMTMFGVTQTTRFRSAVAGAGISDWLSYYGENSIDQWMTPFFGATVYDDPAVYAKSSAITYIRNVKTPTLVIVGDRDGECPAPQSFEFWHALRAEGVKTQLVVYPNEGHGFRDPEHVKDRTEREITWFQREMPAE